MRKTKNISKYNLDWQVTRVLAKELGTVEAKVEHVLLFLRQHRSEQNWERVVNYLEGLSLGYKNNDKEAVRYIQDQISAVGSRQEYAWDIWDHSHIKWSDVDLKKCYKDNMKRYTAWCSKGYLHSELYEFVKSFTFAELDKIEKSKEEAISKPNTHNFFF